MKKQICKAITERKKQCQNQALIGGLCTMHYISYKRKLKKKNEARNFRPDNP